MSKTTQRYGKPQVYHLGIDSNPLPTKQMVTERKVLDGAANTVYGKHYDALTNAEKIVLHDALKSRPDGQKQNEPIDLEAYKALLKQGYVNPPVTVKNGK